MRPNMTRTDLLTAFHASSTIRLSNDASREVAASRTDGAGRRCNGGHDRANKVVRVSHPVAVRKYPHLLLKPDGGRGENAAKFVRAYNSKEGTDGYEQQTSS